MKFFTDEKYENNTAHSEYEKYCRESWDLIPDELKIISKGMLPEDMLSGFDCVGLHDARITTVKINSDSINIELNADHNGALRKIWLEYQESKIIEKPRDDVLGSKADDSDSDIMCHEVGIQSSGQYTHTLLFASEEELQIQFSGLVVRFEDVA